VTTITDLDDFKALDPFFRIIEKGLDGIADGGHFFDLLADDVIFDYIITVPGYPRHARLPRPRRSLRRTGMAVTLNADAPATEQYAGHGTLCPT
jgi:hypothetical protein